MDADKGLRAAPSAWLRDKDGRYRMGAAPAKPPDRSTSPRAPHEPSRVETERGRRGPKGAEPFLDPRLGDMENDRSATKQRSLLAIAGSLIAEISLPKLVFAWAASILLPAVLLGLAPLALDGWIGKASDRLAEATGIGAAIVVLSPSWRSPGSVGARCSGWRKQTSGR